MQHYDCRLYAPEIPEEIGHILVKAASHEDALRVAQSQAEAECAGIYWGWEFYGPLPETFTLRVTVTVAWPLDERQVTIHDAVSHSWEGEVTWPRPTHRPPYDTPAWRAVMGVSSPLKT